MCFGFGFAGGLVGLILVRVRSGVSYVIGGCIW